MSEPQKAPAVDARDTCPERPAYDSHQVGPAGTCVFCHAKLRDAATSTASRHPPAPSVEPSPETMLPSEVFRAWAAGYALQFLDGANGWRDLEPSTNFSVRGFATGVFRLKPSPVPRCKELARTHIKPGGMARMSAEELERHIAEAVSLAFDDGQATVQEDADWDALRLRWLGVTSGLIT